MTDQAIEQEIQAKGKTAPRVTPADIEANISAEAYFTAEEGILGAYKTHNDVYQTVRHDDMLIQPHMKLLTFCVLVLRNGFTVHGVSACASPENFDEEIGRKIARANAVQQIWPLMGYELRSLLALSNGRPGEYAHGERVLHVYAEDDLDGLTPEERTALLASKVS